MDAAKQTVVDMANARARGTVDAELVRDFLHGGRDEWEKRKKILRVLESDPCFDKSRREFMTRAERYTRGMEIVNRIYELEEQLGWTPHETALAFASLDEALPISLHNMAFQPVFFSQASPALLARYGRLIQARGIVGCYLQTELAHGSNVARLETTATYDVAAREFVLHSPVRASAKWWIGALGKTATHGVVQARLLLPGGRDVGPHLFFVQLRGLEDHRVLPGIVIGDIGPKALGGYATTDNGFAMFDHVRIPKDNMLSKFAQVLDDGTYVKPPHAKISYGGMLYIRANMVTGAGWMMAKAATVSIRYATVRRQGEQGPDGLERQIISYPSVYVRLLPILARAYVFIQLGKTITRAFDAMAQRLAAGDASLLAEMHAITAGLKVLVSSTGVADLEVARRVMGGHGFSAFAGLGRLYADYLPSTTYEGDNFVLDQQVVRAALKAHDGFLASRDASSLAPSSAYLRLLLDPAARPPELSDEAALYDPLRLIMLLEWRAAALVRAHAQTVYAPDASVAQRVSRAVTEAFVATQVGAMLDGLVLDGASGRAVRSLYILYLLTTAEAGLVDLLSFGLLRNPDSGSGLDSSSSPLTSTDPTRALRLAIKDVCEGIIPEAIGLSDAFGFSDWELDSALGVYDGNVYESLWRKAQDEPLNATEVPDAYERSIKPILLRGQRQAGGVHPKL